MRYSMEFHEEMLKTVFKPGAVILSVGIRGGGKTHTAIALSEEMIKGKYPSLPKKVFLITNVIFVRKTQTGFVTEAPPGVYNIYSMKELFPLAADILEREGREDTLIILLLDEAQNFLQGESAAKSTMNADMKKFTGIIRKFGMAMWLLTPIATNIGPAFRGFIDSEGADRANVTAMFEKNLQDNTAFIKQRHLDMDPRSIIHLQISAKEAPERLLIPVTSWTRKPEDIEVGDYIYDTLSSADFTIGEGFDFSSFVTAISNGSSYELIPKIRKFYENLGQAEEEGVTDSKGVQEAVRRRERRIAVELMKLGVKQGQIAKAIGVSDRTLRTWKDEEEASEELPVSGQASKSEGRKSDTSAARVIYISQPPAESIGSESPTSSPTGPEGDSSTAAGPLGPRGGGCTPTPPFRESGLPDGRYSHESLAIYGHYYPSEEGTHHAHSEDEGRSSNKPVKNTKAERRTS